jgi:hypothetical protein
MKGIKNMFSIVRKVVAPLALVAAVAAFSTQAANAEPAKDAAKEVKFVTWLKDYIPATFSGAKVADHHDWFGANLSDLKLVVSWAQLHKEKESVGQVHGLKEGKAFFIATDKKENWASTAGVTYFEGAGYYVAGYVGATMGSWDVTKATIVQFDGDAKKFAEDMAKAWAKAKK